ncbi:porphobilinogen synthase [Rickettsiales endosymbiont of Stachyamoeba lipophora]|uniref:porphobilinogen synthase n=1 Tax=Rickettsiales endosymbiont of Stachyamoeba lipophora TaxID=2486578 RepID=UPI000F64E9BD|nr:porphobilinogen synthase [Rickettsiales endosymbiont of Stachyamoeba lipophora]AZL15006.1 porphobilinogen synthase [Rickettsiales endosymbiont of Stachyamoeba lipophora]
MYPTTRLRRLRNQPWLRDIVAENVITTDDLIWPCFITEGTNLLKAIPTLLDVYRYSIDQLLIKLEEAVELGIKAIAIFPSIDPKLKDEMGTEALNPDNLLSRAVKAIKNKYPELGIICDVALDPYTTHGHDGVLNDQELVDNDRTIEILTKQALNLVQAGCSMVAPSDMMDGRIGAIRHALDQQGFYDIPILAYAAKYASGLYASFRDAVGSSSTLQKKDKKHYQMNPANAREALREIELDIREGADIIMIKPGTLYLDIIARAFDNFNTPIFAYHVSSEYAMLKFAAANNALNYNKTLIETMICFKRAGCSGIISYAAIDVAKILKLGETL